MKRNFYGIAAIVLAIVFSAFTSVPVKRDVTDPYWYKIDPNDNFKVVQILGQRTQGSAEDASGCQNTLTTQCVRGYNTDPGYSLGDATASGNFTIMKSVP